MANWDVEKGVSNFDAKGYVETAISNRDAGRTSVSEVSSAWGSVVGMSVERIYDITNAISQWVEEVQGEANKIDETGGGLRRQAFRSYGGEVEEAVDAYIKNVKEYCMNLCSTLRAFCDKAKDARDAWLQTTGNLKGVITSDTAASETGTAYVEQINN